MTDTAGRRIYELAKELDVSSKVLREQIVELGFDWDVSNHMKSLTGEQIDAYHAKVNANAAAPKRIHELAKEMGISSKDLRAKITDLGFDWDVSNHMKVLTHEQQGELNAALSGKKKAKKAAPKKAAAKKAAPKKAAPKKAAKKSTKKAAAKDEEAPKKAAKKSTKKAAAKDEEAPAEDKPKRSRGKKRDDGDKPKRDDRRQRREEVKDPEGFDPVGAGVPYLKAVLKQLGIRNARVSGNYDGRRMELNVKGGGAVALIGSMNAGANGRMLDALQLLVSKVAFGDLSRARSVAIDIDGFRAGRVDALSAAGKRIAEFVKDTELFVRLPAMSNFDRYAFHKSAGRVRGLEVGSEGFGAFRMLGISPRQQRPARDEEAPETVEAAAPVEAAPVEPTPVEAAPVEEAPAKAAPKAAEEAPEEAPTETKRRRRRRSSKTAE